MRLFRHRHHLGSLAREEPKKFSCKIFFSNDAWEADFFFGGSMALSLPDPQMSKAAIVCYYSGNIFDVRCILVILPLSISHPPPLPFSCNYASLLF